MTNQKNRTMRLITALVMILGIFSNTLFAATYTIVVHEAIYYDANDTLAVRGLATTDDSSQRHVLGVTLEVHHPSDNHDSVIVNLRPHPPLSKDYWFFNWSGKLKDKNITITNASTLKALTNGGVTATSGIVMGEYRPFIDKAIYFDENKTLEVTGRVTASKEIYAKNIEAEIILETLYEGNFTISNSFPLTDGSGNTRTFQHNKILKSKERGDINGSTVWVTSNRDSFSDKGVTVGTYEIEIDEAGYYDHNNTLQIIGKIRASKDIYANSMKAKFQLVKPRTTPILLRKKFPLTIGSGVTRTFNYNHILNSTEEKFIYDPGASIGIYTNRDFYSDAGITVGDYSIDIEDAIFFDNNETLYVKGSVSTDRSFLEDHMKADIFYIYSGNKRKLVTIEPLEGSGKTRSFEKTFSKDDFSVDDINVSQILVETNRDVQSSRSITTAQYHVGINQAIFYDVNKTLYVTGEVSTTEPIFAHTMGIIIDIESTSDFENLVRIAPLTEGTGLTRTFKWSGSVPSKFVSNMTTNKVIVTSNRDSFNEKNIHLYSVDPVIKYLSRPYNSSFKGTLDWNCFGKNAGLQMTCPVIIKNDIKYWPFAEGGGGKEYDIVIVAVKDGKFMSKQSLKQKSPIQADQCRYIWKATLDEKKQEVVYTCHNNKTIAVKWKDLK